MTATALIAALGDRSCFKNGRQFAAWLGLVPKQRSSGERARLFDISKRGDRYLRTLMIHGARAALSRAGGKQDPRSLWLGKMRQRRHPNVAAVALANENARIVWAMLSDDTASEPALSVKAARAQAANKQRRSHPGNCSKWQEMEKRSPRRFPNLMCGPAWR